MASQLTEDGHVIPPLNITAPAPIINLRGFKWDTVDEEVQGHDTAPATDAGPSPEPRSSGAVEQAPVQQTLLFAQAIPPVPHKDAVSVLEKAPAAGQLPAPRLPLSPEALGTQLPAQLGLVPGQPLPPAPLFPLTQFQGAYAGNGFNLIFRPRPSNDKTPFDNPPLGPDDNVLELNLTTEQLTFGETIVDIPNRGLNLNNQSDVTLGGFPYLQTIQDVTNRETGKGDRIKPTGIHFEPGMWLNVPATDSPKNGPSVVRMASIPHGTTINAQSLSPAKQATALGGNAGTPSFDVIDTTPFPIGTNQPLNPNPFASSMDTSSTNSPRIPQLLAKFVKAETITTEIIKNPNLVLQNAIEGQDIRENITFEVSTGSPTEQLNGGGTANISFSQARRTLGQHLSHKSKCSRAFHEVQILGRDRSVRRRRPAIHDQGCRPSETHDAQGLYRPHASVCCHAAIEAAVSAKDDQNPGCSDPVLADRLSKLCRSHLAARQCGHALPEEPSAFHDDLMSVLMLMILVALMMRTRLGRSLLSDIALYSY